MAGRRVFSCLSKSASCCFCRWLTWWCACVVNWHLFLVLLLLLVQLVVAPAVFFSPEDEDMLVHCLTCCALRVDGRNALRVVGKPCGGWKKHLFQVRKKARSEKWVASVYAKRVYTFMLHVPQVFKRAPVSIPRGGGAAFLRLEMRTSTFHFYIIIETSVLYKRLIFFWARTPRLFLP